MRWLVVLALAGCGDNASPARPPADANDIPTGDPCNGRIVTAALTAAPHVPDGSVVDWTTNPPTSGPHYAVWAKWDRQFTTLARGNWMHNAEHGGVIFAYRCDAGCDVAATLARLVSGFADDPRCLAPIRHRAIVVADPLLPSDGDVAAVAWGTYYIAAGSCVDDAALTRFYLARVGHGPEDTCADGSGAFGGDPL